MVVRISLTNVPEMSHAGRVIWSHSGRGTGDSALKPVSPSHTHSAFLPALPINGKNTRNRCSPPRSLRGETNFNHLTMPPLDAHYFSLLVLLFLSSHFYHYYSRLTLFTLVLMQDQLTNSREDPTRRQITREASPPIAQVVLSSPLLLTVRTPQRGRVRHRLGYRRGSGCAS